MFTINKNDELSLVIERQLKGKKRNLFSSDLNSLRERLIQFGWYQLDSEIYYNEFTDNNYPCLFYLGRLENKIEIEDEWTLLKSNFQNCLHKRSRFFEESFRLCHGDNDNLPGLTIDIYENCSVIHSRLMIYERNKEHIINFCREIKGSSNYIWNEDVQTEEEMLVKHNSINYLVTQKIFQKTGFFLDHRLNRHQLLSNLQAEKMEFEEGLDLFSYLGSWSFPLLREKIVKQMILVDQGSLSENLKRNLSYNKISEDKLRFIQEDCLNYLKSCKSNSFNLILSDPPAFTKSSGKKNNALKGYRKLHREIIRVFRNPGILCFASCTQYINQHEFEETIVQEITKVYKNFQLIYNGIQDLDHPIQNLSDKSNYIKCLVYKVES